MILSSHEENLSNWMNEISSHTGNNWDKAKLITLTYIKLAKEYDLNKDVFLILLLFI